MHDPSLCGACKFGDCVWIQESKKIRKWISWAEILLSVCMTRTQTNIQICTIDRAFLQVRTIEINSVIHSTIWPFTGIDGDLGNGIFVSI